MSPQTKKDVLPKLRSHYAHAGPAYKSKLIDPLVELFGLHRKSAIRALRRGSVQVSSSRPYHRDDYAHIEQKNWMHIRQWFGYGRFDNPEVVPLLNARTTGAGGQLLNYFCPVLKLQRNVRNGARARILRILQ